MRTDIDRYITERLIDKSALSGNKGISENINRQSQIFKIIEERLGEEGNRLVAELDSIDAYLSCFDDHLAYIKGFEDGLDMGKSIARNSKEVC